ncbi:hypothetical protein BC332_02102 [Capsicum chinense]|nr:hypothetical protein BC332_02102 [Capsicum chinense]
MTSQENEDSRLSARVSFMINEYVIIDVVMQFLNSWLVHFQELQIIGKCSYLISVLDEKDRERIIGPYKRILKWIDETKNAIEPHFQEAGQVEIPFYLHHSKVHDSFINNPVQSPRSVFGPTNGLFHKALQLSLTVTRCGNQIWITNTGNI